MHERRRPSPRRSNCYARQQFSKRIFGIVVRQLEPPVDEKSAKCFAVSKEIAYGASHQTSVATTEGHLAFCPGAKFIPQRSDPRFSQFEFFVLSATRMPHARRERSLRRGQ